MLIHWIWLAHRPSLNEGMKVRLLEHFRDPEAVFYADPEELRTVEGLSRDAFEALADKNLTQPEEILTECKRKKLHILTWQDEDYPVRLKNIPDPPILLYYKGKLPEFDALPLIGIVGTRKASAYGLQTAKRMGYQIGRCGGVVVSGMAYGIDGMAMSGALSAGTFTIGVLGCGADVVYPVSNRRLFQDVEELGCLISEFPPGAPPLGWHFPKRNRLISGLSCGVLVVEAPEKSGALITARRALDQGRDVFAVPGNIDIPTFVGSNQLIRDGAIMAASGWDVMREYEGLYPDIVRRDTQTGPADLPEPEVLKVAQKPVLPRKKKDLKKDFKKKDIDKAASSPYSDVNTIPAGLSPEAQSILACLQKGETAVDDLVAQTGLTTGKLLAILTLLELKGHIKRLPGKRISLK